MALSLVSAHCSLFFSGHHNPYVAMRGDQTYRRIDLTVHNGTDGSIGPGLLRLEGTFRISSSDSHKVSIANGWPVLPGASMTFATLIRDDPELQLLKLVDYLEFGGRVHLAQGELVRGSFGGFSMIEGGA